MRPTIQSLALAASVLAFGLHAAAQDTPLQIRAAVESQRVYVGQHFLLQIQVQGTDQPDPVDISALERDFTVSEAGGGASNSTSVRIVNGRMTQQVRRGYNLNYRLAARSPGDTVIPALIVSANGRSQSTQPISMRVLPPQRHDDFKFRLTLSEARAYVGQPVTLTAEWYVGREVQEFGFTVPLLEDRRFEIVDPPSAGTATGQPADDLMEVALGDRRATARRGVGEIDGRQFTVLRFQKILVPRTAGRIQLPAATVTFQALGERQVRRRGLFDDFFGDGLFPDMFGGGRTMETIAIPSNRPQLEVLDLPSAGRPEGFNGWIGEFEVGAEAKPTSVKVGEPITLSLRVRGTGMRDTAQLPSLDSQPALVRDFIVPREIGAGERREGDRFFTQTLRARHDGVAAIPGIELPYFDPERGQYRIARTDPIPVTVEPSRIVTAEDAEGRGHAGPRQLDVESSDEGIAHNYVGAAALEPMQGVLQSWLRPLGPFSLALALFALPPIVYCAVLAVRFGGKYGDLVRARARPPRARWKKAASGIDVQGTSGDKVAETVLAALREYLGARLDGHGSQAAAWTYGEVATRLGAEAANGNDALADPNLLGRLKSVFERCEASSYAGVAPIDTESKRKLIADASELVDRIEEAQ